MDRSRILRRSRALILGTMIVSYTGYLAHIAASDRSGRLISKNSAAILNSSFGHFSDLNQQNLTPGVQSYAPSDENRGNNDGVTEHLVSSGETLSSIWAMHGSGSEGGILAAEALSALNISGCALRAGEKVSIERKSGEIVLFRKQLSDGASLRISGNAIEGYQANLEAPNVIERQRVVSGLIKSSFAASATEAGLPTELVDDFVDLFSSRVEFHKDFQVGDSFSISYLDRVTDSGQVLKPGAIDKASIRLGSKFLASVKHQTASRSAVYYDERGSVPGEFFLRYPLKFSRISSVFNTARFHPILNRSRAHNGVDFAAPTGTPVRAVGSGVVLFAGFNRSTGYMVRVQHNQRYTTEYMHLSRIAAQLNAGDRIERGELIGAVGSTGLSSGPHLHFGLFDRGVYVDPLKAKLPEIDNGGRAPAVVLAAIQEMRNRHETLVALRENSKRNV